MPYIDLEKLLDKTDGSIYKLVILAYKRALEIADSQPKFVDMSLIAKPSTAALNEIAEGKVHYKITKPSN
jgi:DNA-directed RNA polymerase omega subunit